MGQVSRCLRRMQGGYGHWCPACEEIHFIRTEGDPAWTFDGNLEEPTFGPSVKVTGVQTEKINGEWTGEWVRDAQGKPFAVCCHYFVWKGLLQFQPDCTHALAGQTVRMPDLPAGLAD